MQLIALYLFYNYSGPPEMLYTPPKRGVFQWLNRWTNTIVVGKGWGAGWQFWSKSRVEPFTYQYANGIGFCRTHRADKTEQVTHSPATAWERRVLLHGLLEMYRDSPLRPHVLDIYDDDLTLPFGYQQWPTKDGVVAETYVSQDGGRVVILHDSERGGTLVCVDADREQIPAAVLTRYAEKKALHVFLADFDDANTLWPLRPIGAKTDRSNRWTRFYRELKTAFSRFRHYKS